jgi:ketosteroid isomerase-like protein
MRKSIQRYIVVAAGVMLLAGCAHQRVPEIDRAQLEYEGVAQRQADYHAAMAARDADRIAAMFSEDAVLHIANMPPVEGREAIHRFYTRMFGFLSATSATPETLVVSAGGDMAYGTGRTINEFRGPEGPVSFAGKYALIWRKPGDAWLVAIYTVSSNQQDPAR